MTYRLVFDVAQQIPEIAVGFTAAVMLTIVIAAGLWAFDDLAKAWRLIAVASLALGGTELILGGSRYFLCPIVVAVLGTGVDVLRDRVEAFSQFKVPRGTPTALACTFLLLLASATGLGRLSAIGLANRLNAGQAEVLQGEVTKFFEVPIKQECFTVEDRRFCYSDSGSSAGFNRTRAYGGPIDPGLTVRLAAIVDTIVRLEIAQP